MRVQLYLPLLIRRELGKDIWRHSGSQFAYGVIHVNLSPRFVSVLRISRFPKSPDIQISGYSDVQMFGFPESGNPDICGHINKWFSDYPGFLLSGNARI